MDDDLESVRAFARRVDRSHPTILQAIAEGRITAVARDGDGRTIGVYWHQALEQFVNRTDPTQAERTAQTHTTAPAPAATIESATNNAQQEGRPVAPGAADGDHGYLEHRARTEEFKSKQAELDYLEKLGTLVHAGAMTEASFQRTRTLRDQLLNIPDRISTIAAAERDPVRVHQIITDEIKRVLSEQSVDATQAAGGVAERVAA